MNRLKAGIKKYAFIPYAIYFVAVMLYGMLSLAKHVHWAVPLAIVAVGALTAKEAVGIFGMVVFAVMAVFGLAVRLALPWYEALGLAVAPLMVLSVVTWAVQQLLRAAQEKN